MKVLAALALAAAALASPVTTGAAHAAPNPTGTLCGFAAVTDPQIPGSYTGVIFGGPLAFPDDASLTVAYTGTLVCTVQVGTNDTHVETDSAPVYGNEGRVSAAAGTATYDAGRDEPQYICSRVDFDGRPSLYWDDWAHDWSTSASVSCALAISAESPDLSPFATVLDPIVCPILALVLPPEGDLVLPVLGKVWDCPPYDESGGVGPALSPVQTAFYHRPTPAEARSSDVRLFLESR
jgi:hypothetical protein